MSAVLEIRPVGMAELPDLARLFQSVRTTRHCWCLAFCVSRARFSAGWVTGGNRRRFAQLAAASATPMGVLAFADDEPVGWGACGPRSRYGGATGAADGVLRHRDPAEDDTVWLLPCLFVRADLRGQGLPAALLRAAVDLAGHEGAAALEGWPLGSGVERPAGTFLGREQVFTDAGFRVVDRPTTDRVVMRRDLGDSPAPTP